MLNNVKVVDFDLWDYETGEADVVIEISNGKKIKGFTIDRFEKEQKFNVVLSLFAKDYQIGENFSSEISNINDKYETRVQGKILEHVVSEEDGEYIIVDAGNVFVTVFGNFENNISNKFFNGHGRLDVEFHEEQW